MCSSFIHFYLFYCLQFLSFTKFYNSYLPYLMKNIHYCFGLEGAYVIGRLWLLDLSICFYKTLLAFLFLPFGLLPDLAYSHIPSFRCRRRSSWLLESLSNLCIFKHTSRPVYCHSPPLRHIFKSNLLNS